MIRLVALSAGVAVTAFNGGNVPEEPETVDEYAGMVPAHYNEFDRSKKARCLSDKLTMKACWTDPDGSSFRYGCMPGDTRVFTDSCGTSGCDASDCAGRWSWGGDQQDTCYDDGNHLYEFTCSTDDAEESVVEVAVDTGPVVKTCSELGWPLEPGDLSVCGFSLVANGECAALSSYADAAETCADAGARLCTADELSADETKGTGCKGDCEHIWSSSPCPGGHLATAGAKKCIKKKPTTCVSDDTLVKVRCCADVGGSGVAATSAVAPYPEGFSPSVAKDYKISDGSCGSSTPIAEYSCWTNPNDGTSMRFACKDDDSSVYFQSCGYDGMCNPSSCAGVWGATGELEGQCYARVAEGYLYQYSCPNKN